MSRVGVPRWRHCLSLHWSHLVIINIICITRHHHITRDSQGTNNVTSVNISSTGPVACMQSFNCTTWFVSGPQNLPAVYSGHSLGAAYNNLRQIKVFTESSCALGWNYWVVLASASFYVIFK